MKTARQGLRLRPGFFAPRSPMRERKTSSDPQKTLVESHISGPWMLGLCQPVIDVVLGAGVFEGVRPNEAPSSLPRAALMSGHC